MYIPLADTPGHHSSSGSSPAVGKWSSFIGIVTAIIGNILISFALNTQRYAHMRLSRDREERERRARVERKKKRRVENGYGTQEDIAEERARVNRKAEARDGVDDEVDETAPLIPSVESLDARKTSGSSSPSPSPSEEGDTTDDDTDESTKSKSYLSSPIWWVGIALMTVGEAGNFLAYGFAPASIVSPMGVVALVSNCLIAPLLLHERFRWRDGVGVIIAVGGCVTVVLSASDSNPKLDPDSIWHLITRWEFETYLGVTVGLIVALCFASNRFGDRTILIDLGLVGLFGGYTALSTKGVASLLSNTIWRVVTFPITYLLVAVLVGTAVMQIKYINRALQRFNATMVIPTQFVMFTLSVIIGSAVLYRDFERTTTEQAIKFVGGCALTFLGVYFITSGRNDGADEDDNDEDEPHEGEEGISLIDDERTCYEVRERTSYTGRRPSILAANEPVTSPPLNPANTAAIHADSAAYLLPPRKSSQPKQPPPIHATTSAPEVPTTSTVPAHKPSSARPKTPARGTSNPTATESPSTAFPPTTPQPRRPPPDQQQFLDTPRSQNRHSLASPFTSLGPLTSPLSSSLTAIVADSLRRGVDPMGRRKSLLRRGTSAAGTAGRRDPNAGTVKRHSIASGEMEWPDLESGGEQAGTRVRSLSAEFECGDWRGVFV